jgi:hypothetical protein
LGQNSPEVIELALASDGPTAFTLPVVRTRQMIPSCAYFDRDCFAAVRLAMTSTYAVIASEAKQSRRGSAWEQASGFAQLGPISRPLHGLTDRRGASLLESCKRTAAGISIAVLYRGRG